ncbi:MAG TPA: hypothetical protein P5559_11295, partial [Candidatus Limiplasma sp.]|nr:hypothetical protein [Candidatus Limiplasma sp.]
MKRFRLMVFLLAAVLCLCLAQASGEAVESLSLTGGEIQSLAMLVDYPALQSLTLTDCPALDLTPLANCTKLTSLTIQWSDGYTGGGTYDLSPLKACARLNTLALIGQGIADLTSLPGIAKLSALTIRDTAVTDFSPIAQLKLKRLALYGADADAVAGSFTAIGRGLTSAAVGGCTLTPEANDAILSCTRLISLRFVDAEGIDGESARWAKLKNLTTLSITDGSVSSLRFCDSYVSTVGVKLTDVSTGGVPCSVDFDKYFLKTANVPQAELHNLLQGEGRRWQYVVIRNNNALYESQVVAALMMIPGLLSLDIQGLTADAFNPDVWREFAKLEQLKISDCPVVPLQMLNGIPGLLRLSVRNAAIEGADAIPSLQKLQQLTLIRCTADDWSFLSALKNTQLSQLSLAQCNGPQTLAFAKDLVKLKVLVLDNSPVTDLAPISGMALETISVYGCDIM